MNLRAAVAATALSMAIAAWAVPARAADGAGSPGMDGTLRDFAAAAPAADAAFRPEAFLAPPPMADEGGATWDLRVAAWSYATSANFTASVGGGDVHYEADYGQCVFTGARFEALRNRIGALAEVEFSAANADGELEDVDFQSRRLDLGLIFRVVGVDADGRGLTLDLFGGGRYWMTRQETSSGDTDRGEWWEPFVGGEFRLPVPLFFDLVARVQASGFGVGGTTLNADALVGLEFTLGPVLVQAGWRFQDVKYDVDSGAGFSADYQQNGPWIGVGFDI